MKTTNTTQKLVASALLAALACVATMIIKIPTPMKGYANLGDAIVLLCGFMLSPLYAFLAAGIGSGLADVFSGYAIYAPATFLIKGVMALIAYYGYRWLRDKIGCLPCGIVSGVVAESVMVAGYFLFEGCLYGFAPSAVNIPANGVQGAVGLILGCVLLKVLEKTKLSFR